MKRKFAFTVVLVFSIATAFGQAVKDDAAIKAEDIQAETLFNKQDLLGALPLFEDLHAQRPQSMVYTERLAMTLCAKAGTQTGSDQAATYKRAKGMLLQAQKLGDNSNLLQTLLEKLQDSGTPQPPPIEPKGHEWLAKGEAAFSSGNLPSAVELYAKAYAENPDYYAAALFAGDAEFKQNHPAEAGTWFARAIKISPFEESAHRYWGDCLERAGEHQRAEDEFILAIIAQPYQRAPRIGLKQWADKNHAMIVSPPIRLPAGATKGSNGGIKITVSPSSKKDDPEMSLDMAYAMQIALWQGDNFKKHFPNEKEYRHSLMEEAESIRTMLTVAKELKISESKLGESTRLLSELDKKGMLESWILLDNADDGIAEDYVVYRKDHHDIMAKYIAEYDVHKM